MQAQKAQITLGGANHINLHSDFRGVKCAYAEFGIIRVVLDEEYS
jgi:hypothetical protein